MSKHEMEPLFMDEVISPRAIAYVKAVVSRLKLESMSRTLLQGDVRLLVMFLQPVVERVLIWMNPSISLMDTPRSLLTLSDIYYVIGVMLYTHKCTC